MNQRKLNISRGSAVGLAAVLLLACILLATGNAWARYRPEAGGDLTFQTRRPVTVHLGRIDPVSQAFKTTQPVWEMEDGQMLLRFAAANGTSFSNFEHKSQIIRIRVIGSLGLGTGDTPSALMLTGPDGTGKNHAGTAVRIAEDSPLHRSFGEGWVYRFLDANGEELTWTLEGGALSWADFSLALIPGESHEVPVSQVQIQIISENAE